MVIINAVFWYVHCVVCYKSAHIAEELCCDIQGRRVKALLLRSSETDADLYKTATPQKTRFFVVSSSSDTVRYSQSYWQSLNKPRINEAGDWINLWTIINELRNFLSNKLSQLSKILLKRTIVICVVNTICHFVRNRDYVNRIWIQMNPIRSIARCLFTIDFKLRLVFWNGVVSYDLLYLPFILHIPPIPFFLLISP